MKKIICFIYLLLFSLGVSAQEENVNQNYKSDLRVSMMLSVPLGNINSHRYHNTSGPTGLLSGFDVKTIFNSKTNESLSFILGTFFQKGANKGSASYDIDHILYSKRSTDSYCGAIYFGPQLSSQWKYVNLSGYITGGIFSVYENLLEVDNRVTLYDTTVELNSPGIKAGFNLSFTYNRFSLAGGYQMFFTSGNGNSFLYNGIEAGLGVKF